MAAYSDALANPMDAAKMKAAADMLRRRETMATIGQLSGDPILGRFGEGERKRISGRRKSLRGAMETARKRKELKPTGTPGIFKRGEKLEEYTPYFARRLAEKKADREAAMARAQMMAEGRQRKDDEWYAREAWKRSMGTPAQMAEARKTLAYLPELQNLAQELQQKEIEIPSSWEAGADFAREYLPLGSHAAAGIEREGFSPEAMRWIERGRQAESDIIRLASGLAVTGFELENVKKWSPWAGNLTSDQRTDRIRNIYNKLGREATAIGGQVWQDTPMESFLKITAPTAGEVGQAPQMTPGQVPQTMPPASDEELQRQYEALQQWKATQGAP